MKKSSTLTLTCFTIASLALAGCGDDESTPSECTGEDCGDQPAVCDPACAEGDVCKEGHCYTCSSSGKCYLNDVVVEKTCENSDECGAYEICENHKCIPDPNPDRCDPECTDGQICQDGTCVNATLLWTLCQSDSDCGITNGTCTFTVAPSKPMFYKGKKYGNGENIPVSLLDERINTENYNATHKFAAAATSTIGICTQNCSTKNECEEGFTCQLVAEADPIYPTDVQLPVDLPEDDLAKPGFAAICRRVMNERLAQDMPYNAEFCHQDEETCKAAGGIFVDGMCLDKCDPDNNQCPYTFSCEEVDGQNVCMPNTHTCTACHDDDKDGYGYGHCVQQGIDCNDANPDVHYNRAMTCDDVADKAATDLNCNGLIDYFEMVGTPDNCNACGDTCYANQSGNTRVACIPSNGVKIADDWRKTATFENTSELPEFSCVLTCDFGWGNCYDTDKPNGCETQLYVDKTNTATMRASAVNGNATVWGVDNDGDGFIGVNNEKSKELGEIVFDGDNTLLCCGDTSPVKSCYEANAGWKAVTRSTDYVQIENAKLPSAYDANDNASTINPDSVEQCDGIDNDGSLILTQSLKLPDCKSYCANKDIDCKSLKIEVDGKYEFNPYCDATPDGSAETTPWFDTAESKTSNKGLFFGDNCALRHETNEICDANAIVSCTNMQEVRCFPGDDHCACSYDPNTGIVQYHTEAGYLGKLEYKVKTAMGDVTTIICQCDGSDTEENCIVQCNTFCVKKYEEGENSYALACTPNRNKAATSDETDNKAPQDGIDDKGNFVFNGIDENCNGIPDDDAMVPCLITLNEIQSPYQYTDANGQELGFVNGVINEISPYGDNIERYVSFANYNDGTIEKYQTLLNSIKNVDGSINICRLGWLQPNQTIETDPTSGISSVKYGENLCVPLYKSRDFDFMGDGIDSNCDGVDYDMNNVVYVSTDSEQLDGIEGFCETPTSAESTCFCDNSSKPCNNLHKAINISQNHTRNFFKDILILSNKEVNISSSIQIPTLTKSPNLPKGNTLTPSIDNDYTGLQKEHILNAYQFHRELIRRKKDGENIYEYNYGYEVSVSNTGSSTSDYSFSKSDTYEMRVPAEQVRIFGGFKKDKWEDEVNKRPNWIKAYRWLPENKQSKIIYSITDKDVTSGNDLTFVMIEPKNAATANNEETKFTANKLSLGLYNLDLSITAEKVSEIPKNKRDGITITGINGYLGIDILTFVNTHLSVTAPSGYSFKDYPLDSNNYEKIFSTGDNKDDFNYYMSNGDVINSNKVRPPQAYSAAHKKNNTDDIRKTPSSNSCSLGIEGVNAYKYQGGSGGIGGLEHAYGGTNYAGRNGARPTNYLGNPITSDTGGKGADLGCDKGDDTCNSNNWGGRDWETHRPGSPATRSLNLTNVNFNGQYGEFTNDHPFSWHPQLVNNSLYINSDRSGGRGYYGGIGGGGGGGDPFQCSANNDTDNEACSGGNGGTGGCGGIGGEAGGTGGSALGIVMASHSATNLTVFNFDKNSNILVQNGLGGDSQVGALGQPGGMGGYHEGYSREGPPFNRDHECVRSSCGGGGGAGGMGGAGAAGRVGWPFPLVLICDVPGVSLSDKGVTLSESEAKEQTQYRPALDCGFKLPSYILTAGKDTTYMAVNYQKADYNNCSSKSPFALKVDATTTKMMPIYNIVDIPLTPSDEFAIDHLMTREDSTGGSSFVECDDKYLGFNNGRKYKIDFCRNNAEIKCQGETINHLSDFYNASTYICSPESTNPASDDSVPEDKSMITQSDAWTSGFEWTVQFIKVLNQSDIGQYGTNNAGTAFHPYLKDQN